MSRSIAGAIIVAPRTGFDQNALGASCQVCGAQNRDFSAVGGGKPDIDVLLEVSLSNAPNNSAWISKLCENCATALVTKIETELTYLSRVREMEARGTFTTKAMLGQISARAAHVVSREKGEQLGRFNDESAERMERSKAEFVRVGSVPFELDPRD